MEVFREWERNQQRYMGDITQNATQVKLKTIIAGINQIDTKEEITIITDLKLIEQYINGGEKIKKRITKA